MRKLSKAIIQIILILFFTLIVIEVILQVVYLNLPQAITQRMPQYPERYGIQFDTAHGAREYPPNEVVYFEVNQFSGDLYQVTCLSPKDALPIEPYQVSYTRNEHGFRTPELNQPDAEIVIIGDSFTAAESIISPYWEDLGFSTVALGLPGSGTVEQKILLEEFGLPHNPNIIILAYFAGNDLTDNLVFHNLQQQNLTFADATHQNRSPLEYLVTFHLALFIRDALATPSDTACPYPITVQTQPPTPVAFFDRMVTLLALDQQNLENSDAFNLTQDTIVDIAEAANQANAEFILMYIPQKAELYWNMLNTDDKQNVVKQLEGNQLIEKSNITVDAISNNVLVQKFLLEQLAINEGFHFLDLTPVLQMSAENGTSPYFFSDTHWNQLGHDIAKETLLNLLSQVTLDKNTDS